MAAALPVSLDDLIRSVRDAAPEDPLEQLAEAARHKDELAEAADALLGHFVDQARRSGCSWTQIGEALGVTKQAAQQKHTPLTYDRFTDRARVAVVAAQEHARSRRHAHIGTEHMLLGVLDDPRSVGSIVLADLGLTRGDVESVIAEAGSGVATEGHVPFAPRSKKVLEITFREALDLGHNYIGTEHLVLALAREKKGAAGKLLAERSITPKALRERIVQILIGLQQAAAPGGAVAPSVASEGRLYGRLTQRARAVLARSERAARAHGQSDVGAEHLLLGLFDLPDIAARILAKRFDLDRGSIEEAILERVPRGTGSPDGELPFTPGAKRTLDAAIKEAMKLGETFAGTEHLLLALASGDGVARDVLDKFAASYEEVKQGVQAALVDEL